MPEGEKSSRVEKFVEEDRPMLNGELWTGKKYAAGEEYSGVGGRSKKALAGAAALAMLVTMGFSACGTSSTEDAASKPEVSDSSETNKKTEKKPAVKKKKASVPLPDLSKITWNVNPAMEGNSSRLAVSYTNSLDVDLLDFKVSYTLKPEVTDEQLQSLFGGDDWTTPEDVREYGLRCEVNKYVPAGETGLDYCVVGGLKTSVTNQMDLWNITQIDAQYYDSGAETLQNVQYLPSNKVTVKNGPAVAAYKWIDNKLSARVPKPEVPVVQNMHSSRGDLFFQAYSSDPNMMQAYAELCEQKGRKVAEQTDYTIEFVGKDGYSLRLSQGDYMSVDLSKQDDDE